MSIGASDAVRYVFVHDREDLRAVAGVVGFACGHMKIDAAHPSWFASVVVPVESLHSMQVDRKELWAGRQLAVSDTRGAAPHAGQIPEW
ncbi:hypothetical protein ACVBGC_00520 [Burkholderia stagnalis]